MGWQAEKEQVGRALIRALYEHGMIRTWFRDNPSRMTIEQLLFARLEMSISKGLISTFYPAISASSFCPPIWVV